MSALVARPQPIEALIVTQANGPEDWRDVQRVEADEHGVYDISGMLPDKRRNPA